MKSKYTCKVPIAIDMFPVKGTLRVEAHKVKSLKKLTKKDIKEIAEEIRDEIDRDMRVLGDSFWLVAQRTEA